MSHISPKDQAFIRECNVRANNDPREYVLGDADMSTVENGIKMETNASVLPTFTKEQLMDLAIATCKTHEYVADRKVEQMKKDRDSLAVDSLSESAARIAVLEGLLGEAADYVCGHDEYSRETYAKGARGWCSNCSTYIRTDDSLTLQQRIWDALGRNV